jgi:hypothetical protein
MFSERIIKYPVRKVGRKRSGPISGTRRTKNLEQNHMVKGTYARPWCCPAAGVKPPRHLDVGHILH